MALHETPEQAVPHEYGPSRVGHGDAQCKWCLGTNRENAIISPNHCDQRKRKDPTYNGEKPPYLVFQAGSIINFDYVNYRGEQGFRRACVLGVDYGRNEWYPSPQWFIRCWDFDKDAVRSFALAKINPYEVLVIESLTQEDLLERLMKGFGSNEGPK